jgi:hypothetical protein
MDMFEAVGKQFECRPVVGVASHVLERKRLSGPRRIPMTRGEEKFEDHELKLGDVIALDVVRGRTAADAAET